MSVTSGPEPTETGRLSTPFERQEKKNYYNTAQMQRDEEKRVWYQKTGSKMSAIKLHKKFIRIGQIEESCGQIKPRNRDFGYFAITHRFCHNF